MKKSLIIAMTLMTSMAAFGQTVTGKTIKVFTGANGEKGTILYLDPSSNKEALVKIEGFSDTDLDDKVYKVKRQNGGSGENYVTSEGRLLVTMRKNYGSEEYQLYPTKASNGVNVGYDSKESKNVKAQDMISEFQKK